MGAECLATLVASLEERVKNMEKGSSMKFIQVNLVEGIEATSTEPRSEQYHKEEQ